MSDFALVMVAAVGLSHIVVESPLLGSFKDWLGLPGFAAGLRGKIQYLLGCYQCTGFWTGLLCGWAVYGVAWHTLLAGPAASLLSKGSANLFARWRVGY